MYTIFFYLLVLVLVLCKTFPIFTRIWLVVWWWWFCLRQFKMLPFKWFAYTFFFDAGKVIEQLNSIFFFWCTDYITKLSKFLGAIHLVPGTENAKTYTHTHKLFCVKLAEFPIFPYIDLSVPFLYVFSSFALIVVRQLKNCEGLLLRWQSSCW